MSETDMDGPARANYLATIHNVQERRIELASQLRLLVKAAVEVGATWQDVGEALGVSGQAAWHKYRGEGPQKILPRKDTDHVE